MFVMRMFCCLSLAVKDFSDFADWDIFDYLWAILTEVPQTAHH